MRTEGVAAMRDVRTCVSASSLERPFLRRLLSECARFSTRVAVSYCSHLYSGEPEDLDLFQDLRHEFDESHPGIFQFVQYESKGNNSCANHNSARVTGFRALKNNEDPSVSPWWVLFLDADEIPDGEAMRCWINQQGVTNTNLEPSTAYKLSNYWYFLLPTLRADALEDSVLLLPHSSVTVEGLQDRRERDGILAHTFGIARVKRGVLGDGGLPMFHHYSWVRTRPDLLRKVEHWGHRLDRPWRQLLEHAWALIDRSSSSSSRKEIDGEGLPSRDFVHGYKLLRVPDVHGIRL